MTAADNHALIERFYGALQRRDADTMAACYHRRATFQDPAFTLQGENIGAMWKMLCERGKDLRVEFAHVWAEGDVGSAAWEAWYTFSKTGRPVHNRILAHFRFAEGLIVEHVDRFDFWRWSRQALGPAGLLLGWAPPFRAKVAAEANKALDSWMTRQPTRA